jgi:hypothetical protein
MTKPLKIMIPNDGSHDYLKGKTARIYIEELNSIKKGEFQVVDSIEYQGNVFSSGDIPMSEFELFWMGE